MTTEDKVKAIKKVLREAIVSNNHSDALDKLKTLENLPVTLDILSKTRIGFTVNKLRKSSDNEEIKTRSKNLIKNWRKFIYEKKDVLIKEEVKNEEKTKNKKENSKEKKKEKGTSKQEKVNKKQNSEEVRIKCRQLLTSALKANLNESIDMSDTPENLATQLEDMIFKEFEDTNVRYRNRIRSRIANLKDQKNPELKEKFLRGEISVSELATMGFNEMASDKLKDSRKQHYYGEEAFE
ncbi:hypothetical protein O3M35_008498 [Rhynocoris fuscipes]|uniref:Uncharacterized protein n=1 Tax=Rhynocoris fuscipes TaxID=488301 RepID=A0AAW1D801_9HEMI